MTKNRKFCLLATLLILLCTGIFLVVALTKNPAEEDAQTMDGNSLLDVRTWEDYQALSLEEQDKFFEQFDSKEAFEAWMEAVNPSESGSSLDWDESRKRPDQHTWKEYQKLTLEEQDAFFKWFDSEEAFEAWMEKAKPAENEEATPVWNKSGKLPNEYTWKEYQKLTSEEQDAFFMWFDAEQAFEAWMEKVKPAAENEETTPVWNKSGKLPNEYTWKEYQKLTSEEQDAFFMWFGTVEAFEAWMEKVKPTETTETTPVWNKSGKLPNEYTWKEYQKLTPEEQDAFFMWFSTVDAFEAWMEKVKPAENEETTPVWNKSGKLPNEYTWKEYQKLTPEEQDAFFMWFGSVDAFEAWMEKAKPVETTEPTLEWNKTGKLPNEYTWEEYQKLTPEEQDAFFTWFGSVEAFENWMDMAMGD